MRIQGVFRVTVAAIAVVCAAAGCSPADEPTVVAPATAAQKYFPRTVAPHEGRAAWPLSPATSSPPTVQPVEVTVAPAVPTAADGTEYGDVCTQVEEFRVALGDFTGEPVTDKVAIDATIEFYRTEGAAAGMSEEALDGLILLLNDCA